MTCSVIGVLRFSTSDSSPENFICFVLFVHYEPKKCRRPLHNLYVLLRAANGVNVLYINIQQIFAAEMKFNPQHSSAFV